MKRKYLIFWILILISGSIYSQTYFTNVESGAPVTDPGKSYGNSFTDVNGDGYEDIFICNSYDDQPNVLYLNQGDGTFVVDQGILNQESAQSLSASWGDYDNDGDSDLYVSNVGAEAPQNFFYTNNGDGTFTKETTGIMTTDLHWSISCSWVDYDNDGWLDMFVANFTGPNDLYHNNGDGSFTAITTGEIVTENWASFGCTWADYDNDGWQDLFVANNYFDTLPAQNNSLFHNNGDGTFTKILDGEIVNDAVESHGASWGDYNNDGWVDLFLTNHDWNENEKNFLYQNNGDGTFTRILDLALEADENTTMGSTWLDANSDGYLDLYYANTRSGMRQNGLFINNGDGTFTQNTVDPSVLDEFRSDGCASGDTNNDGRPDLFSASYSTSHYNGFYINNGSDNNWVALHLIGSESNRSAIGARIEISAGDMLQTRQVSGQTGFYSQNSLKQYFGIGTETSISNITIYWPSGIVQNIPSPAINQLHTITEFAEELNPPLNLEVTVNGLLTWLAPTAREFVEYRVLLDNVEQATTTETEFQLTNLEQGANYTAAVSAIYTSGESELVEVNFTADLTSSDLVDVPNIRNLNNYPNPFNPTTNIKFSLNESSHVTLDIFNEKGQKIVTLLNETKSANTHIVNWNGTDESGKAVASGIYLYKIKTNCYHETKKMVLLK